MVAVGMIEGEVVKGEGWNERYRGVRDGRSDA